MEAVRLIEEGPESFADIWPFFRDILAEGRTYSYPLSVTEAEGQAIWHAPDRRVFIARDAGGKALASCYLRANRDGPGDHVANAGFMVSPQARGQGLARHMGRFLLEEARRSGYLAMQFNFVVATNTSALNAWRDIGMAIVGTIPDGYRLPGGGFSDAYVMWKRLS